MITYMSICWNSWRNAFSKSMPAMLTHYLWKWLRYTISWYIRIYLSQSDLIHWFAEITKIACRPGYFELNFPAGELTLTRWRCLTSTKYMLLRWKSHSSVKNWFSTNSRPLQWTFLVKKFRVQKCWGNNCVENWYRYYIGT